MARSILVAVALCGAAALVGLVLLWPTGEGRPESISTGTEYVDATVTKTGEAPCAGTPEASGIRCRTVFLLVTSGSPDGETTRIEQTIADTSSPPLEADDEVVLGYAAGAPDGFRYFFVDYQRGTPLLLLAGLFVVAVLALGRRQGLRALIGLAASLLVLVVFLLPALLEGASPVAAAAVAATVVAFLALYLAHGINIASSVALLGTLASLALTCALGAVFVSATRLTGLSDDSALFLQIGGGAIDIRGLLLAGIIIGTLGVLDDVTVTQVSAVAEVARADPTMGDRDLYRAGIRVGRDHVSSTVNTLVLAYAGAALPLLLLFTQSSLPLARTLTGEVVAIELVRTLVGSIGLVASVPITTALAARTVRPRSAFSAATTEHRPAE